MIELSILDYSPVDEGTDQKEALRVTTEMVKKADALGFKRFWVSEHHGMYHLAGSNPEMLMMHLAANSKRIRLGSGGVMLSHYSAYKVAESFTLLEALYPNRIDLGTGRAPGAGRPAQIALSVGKDRIIPYDKQLRDVKTHFLQNEPYLATSGQLLTSPAIDTLPEMWCLGSGEGSAQIAAAEGTGFVFAHFINPWGNGVQAVDYYRDNFEPSIVAHTPQTMVATFVAVAETDEKAEYLAKGFDHWALMNESGRETPYYMSPETAATFDYNEREQQVINANRQRIIVGTPQKVAEGIRNLAALYQTNEILLLPNIYGRDNRLASLDLLAAEFKLNSNIEITENVI